VAWSTRRLAEPAGTSPAQVEVLAWVGHLIETSAESG
jgi:hypothetical protein